MAISVFPDRMNRTDPENPEESIRTIDTYIRYMVDQVEFALTNSSRNVNNLGVTGEALALSLNNTINDVSALSSTVQNKVDKVAGKGLSTNDFTDEDKAKISEIGGIYPVIGTQAAATGAWTGNLDVPALYDGLTIAYYLPYAGDGAATLNLTLADETETGAVPIYYTGTTALTTQYAAGSTIVLTYWSAGSISVSGTPTTEARWTRADYNTNSNTVAMAYCSTSAGTAGKTASSSGYALLDGSYLLVTIANSNTKSGALTLNVNSTGAKSIYINGTASSASNKTLPAGPYLVLYKDSKYWFRTDGTVEGLASEAEISDLETRVETLEDILTGSGPVLYQNAEDVTAAEGDDAIFSVRALGTNLTYKWELYYSSSWTYPNFQGKDTPNMTVPATASRNLYRFRCTITGGGWTIYSKTVTLHVTS